MTAPAGTATAAGSSAVRSRAVQAREIQATPSIAATQPILISSSRPYSVSTSAPQLPRPRQDW